MQNKVFAAVAFNIIVNLLIKHGTERNNCERLRFTAGKYRRSVRARQYTDFAGNGPDIFQTASVNAQSFFQNIFAEDMIFHLIK